MKCTIAHIRIPITATRPVAEFVCRQYGIDPLSIRDCKIVRQAIDARNKNHIIYDYQVLVDLPERYRAVLQDPSVTPYTPPAELIYPKWHDDCRPVIVGFGPSGMFAALYLARCRAHPIILERGEQIEQRKLSVQHFLTHKQLNCNSNVQFGEGGAGTFSDGKLNTNVHSDYNAFILQEFYRHGAPEDVTYLQNPHVGTDYLERVVRNIRIEIESLGGTFHFNTQFVDFETHGDELHLLCEPNIPIKTHHLLLGLGHSARDTITGLHQHGLTMEPKSFSMGVRIEHLQSKINRIQYGAAANLLPPASYKAVVHLHNRGIYSFCMCPGGMVMASANEPNTIVTNGMSEYSRNRKNANSALLVSVNPEDYATGNPLDGLYYQSKYEHLAYSIGNDYRAPGNLIMEFLDGKVAHDYRSVTPSYPHGLVYTDFRKCLPDYVVQSLREAIPLIDKKLHGFAEPDAVLTGIETRSSSAVRLLRNEQRNSSQRGIYPIGEGAGYAGGIMSAAIDGLKTGIMITINQ